MRLEEADFDFARAVCLVSNPGKRGSRDDETIRAGDQVEMGMGSRDVETGAEPRCDQAE